MGHVQVTRLICTPTRKDLNGINKRKRYPTFAQRDGVSSIFDSVDVRQHVPLALH
jgi:hypothetical protein